MELKNIVVLGPGGNVGKAIITELLKDGQRFNITAVTRLASTYIAPQNSNIIHKKVDYTSSASLIEAFSNQDAIVNCITGGATQYDPSKLIVDAAVAAKVKFFFANEFVGYVTSERYKRMPESYVGAKVRIREYLQELGNEGKLSWTSLNGGPFFDMWLMKGPAGFDIPNRLARIYGTGNTPLYWTPLPTLALAAANMLRNPRPISNRPIYICPLPQLSQLILLRTLESILDTPFTVENIDVKKICDNAEIALARGEVTKAIKGLTLGAQFSDVYAGNDFSHLVENETVGVEGMSVETAVREAIARWGEDCKVIEGMFRIEPCEV